MKKYLKHKQPGFFAILESIDSGKRTYVSKGHEIYGAVKSHIVGCNIEEVIKSFLQLGYKEV